MKNRQTGLSLIEIMVSLVLGLILISGVTQIFVGNKRAFELSQDMGVMQEGGRIASTILSEAIRMADYWGGLAGDDVTLDGSVTLPTSFPCTGVSDFNTSNSIQGYEGGTTPPSNCVPSSDYVPNSDMIFVRYADSKDLVSGNTSDPFDSNSYYVRAATGEKVKIFQGSGGEPSDMPDQDGTFNMVLRTDLYFLRKCAIKATACIDSTPTLVKYTLVGNKYEEIPVVEGVEQLQFEYGLDTDNDQNVDDYKTASAVTDWSEVISVRMAILTRSENLDVAVDEGGKKYALVGDMGVGSEYVIPAADKHFRHRLYTRDVQVRNRSRSL